MRRGEGTPPYGSRVGSAVGGDGRPRGLSLRRAWGACGRADVGSESSVASGRGSEMSQWPRSKFQASAVRQRGNFGHRNRVIVPYGMMSEKQHLLRGRHRGHP